MKANERIVEPYLRLLLASGAVALAFLLEDPLRLFILWMSIFVGAAIATRVVKIHLLFLLYACLPIFVGSLAIHAANHGDFRTLGHAVDLLAVVQPAAIATARIAVVGLVMQIFFVGLLQQALL